ncbi:MAG: DUF6807 family protein [Planctomycetota bacterium]
MHRPLHDALQARRATRCAVPILLTVGMPLAAGAWLAMTAAAVALDLERHADRVAIVDDAGRTAAVFTFGDRLVGRPAIRDLHTPGGVMVTRPCPIRPGIDPDDHATLHPGVMLCFSDLSGADPWRHKTAVRFGGFRQDPALDQGRVGFTFAADYLAEPEDTPSARVVCREESTITIADRSIAGTPVRIVTWDARLAAGDQPVTFADVEEMGFGIRLIRELSPKWGGCYRAAHGGRDERGVFGTQAAWCDASGEVGGTRVGVTLVDRGFQTQPAYFHARDYGWLLANPFGRRSYTKGDSAAVTVSPGESLELHYGLVLHDDVADDLLPGIVASAWAAPE